MSTATLPRSGGRARRDADARPSLVQLTAVELRKMTDTRAGFWLLVTLAGLTALTVLLVGLTSAEADHRLQPMLYSALQPASILLPIVGILLVTSEWSQRTALITFALVPQRSRILIAKVLASVALAVMTFLVTIALAVIGTGVAAAGLDGQWSLSAGLFGQMALSTVLSTAIGVAFGAAILLSAPAIVGFFVIPLAVTAATHLIGPLEGIGQWIDQARTLPDLLDHAYSAGEWGRAGTTLLLWLVVPLAVGAWRFTKGEIR
jgi:ABC-2 type transport system permease protein